MEKKETRGGSRPGSGRPAGTPTVVINFRVPADKAEVIKRKTKIFIKNLLKKSTN